MGMFSRKEKPAKVEPPIRSSYSTASANSGGSKGFINRISGGSVGNGNPLSPGSQASVPRIDLPRPPDPNLDPAGYLRSLVAIRERSRIVYQKALKNDLKHFDVDFDKMSDVVAFITGLVRVSLPPSALAPSCLRTPVRI